MCIVDNVGERVEVQKSHFLGISVDLALTSVKR